MRNLPTDFAKEQTILDAILVNVFAAASLIASGNNGHSEYHFNRGEEMLAESKKRGYADLAALDRKTKETNN
jgi:hypothetical protein